MPFFAAGSGVCSRLLIWASPFWQEWFLHVFCPS
jgi:hypothetical protein